MMWWVLGRWGGVVWARPVTRLGLLMMDAAVIGLLAFYWGEARSWVWWVSVAILAAGVLLVSASVRVTLFRMAFERKFEEDIMPIIKDAIAREIAKKIPRPPNSGP